MESPTPYPVSEPTDDMQKPFLDDIEEEEEDEEEEDDEDFDDDLLEDDE